MSGSSWDIKFVGAQPLLAKEYDSDAGSFICALIPGSSSAQVQRTPGGLLFIRDSSNLQYVTSSTLVVFTYQKPLVHKPVEFNAAPCSSLQQKSKPLLNLRWTTSLEPTPSRCHTWWVLVTTTQQICTKEVRPFLQSRTSAPRWTAMVATPSESPNPNTHVGAVVGGPDVNDQFQNARSDYSHSEPTTYNNAAFVGSAAALLA